MKGFRIFAAFVALSLIITLTSACSSANKALEANGKYYTISYKVSEKVLKTGRYYENGDISKPYVEVFDNKTLQWFGMNIQGFDDSEEQGISAVHSYTIVELTNADTTVIALDFVEESGYGHGFFYIDENSFKFADNEVFIYTE